LKSGKAQTGKKVRRSRPKDRLAGKDILFLDIHAFLLPNKLQLSPTCIGLLRNLISGTRTGVVILPTWRKLLSGKSEGVVREMFADFGVENTEVMSWPGPNKGLGKALEEYLGHLGGKDSYLVISCNKNVGAANSHRLLFVRKRGGFDGRHMTKAVNILIKKDQQL